ncbi:hypothetical protein GGG16DRAFT_108458 [Schizophyllum commune]
MSTQPPRHRLQKPPSPEISLSPRIRASADYRRARIPDLLSQRHPTSAERIPDGSTSDSHFAKRQRQTGGQRAASVDKPDSASPRASPTLYSLPQGTTISLQTKTGAHYEGVVMSTSGEGDTTGVRLKDVKDISHPGALKDQQSSGDELTFGPGVTGNTSRDQFATHEKLFGGSTSM